MTTNAAKYKMLTYRRQGEIDYASLDFDPDEIEVPPDHMEQSQEIHEVIGLLMAWFTDFWRRPDVFLDTDTNICYDRRNLNVRVAPDVYLAFGVDARAIRPRKLYLPWEVGKQPDWVLEIASSSTSRVDVRRKPAIYAQIGVPEYWRFDPTGGRYYGQPLYGGRLANGAYQPVELTTEPDGILKGYSEVLGLSLCWDEGWPRFYDPSAGRYLDNWRSERAARQAAESERDRAEFQRDRAESQRDDALSENRRLRDELHRLRGEG